MVRPGAEMTRPAVAIFVKTPGRSPVKTRLAATVGAANAERFYRLCVAAIEAVARSCGDGGLTSYWAVAEAEALDDPIWKGFKRVPQGEGGLGARLDRVYRHLRERHPAVLLIGADAPLLSRALIGAAASAVQEFATPFALSRSADGGYALFGGARPLPREVWTAVPYSCERTAAAFAANLRPHGGIAELLPVDDVDSFEDLEALVPASSGLVLRPEQDAVVDFARDLIASPGHD